ncbi:hypothetical protein DBV05_g9970 [Lasiodiplodia theobromae]|uniref:Uncharacterized protein n=1 Tax=Lasiodiplodia theobromae TaxID=45133 RepID=A0A5N5D193_9PEZI|nr:hypothetical protein DBV05_g9970 [Lasiodiplodia theobromae]
MDSFITNEQPIPCMIRADRYGVSCLKSRSADIRLELPFNVTIFLNKHLLNELRRLDKRSMTTTSVYETLYMRLREQFDACDSESIRGFADERSVVAAVVNATVAVCEIEERFIRIDPQVLEFGEVWKDWEVKDLLLGFGADVKATLAVELEAQLLSTQALMGDYVLPELLVYDQLFSIVRKVLLDSADEDDKEMVEEAQKASLAITQAIAKHLCRFE